MKTDTIHEKALAEKLKNKPELKRRFSRIYEKFLVRLKYVKGIREESTFLFSLELLLKHHCNLFSFVEDKELFGSIKACFKHRINQVIKDYSGFLYPRIKTPYFLNVKDIKKGYQLKFLEQKQRLIGIAIEDAELTDSGWQCRVKTMSSDGEVKEVMYSSSDIFFIRIA